MVNSESGAPLITNLLHNINTHNLNDILSHAKISDKITFYGPIVPQDSTVRWLSARYQEWPRDRIATLVNNNPPL